MRILVTLVFLLSTGILSSTIAYLGMSPMTPSHLELLGFFNTTIEDVEEFDRKLCATNGGPTAYDNHNESVSRFERCHRSVSREVSLAVSKMTPKVVAGGRDFDFIKEYCHRIPNIGNCIKNLTDSMKTCLDVEKHESANVVYNTANELMKFMCQDFSVPTMIKSITLLECMRANHPALKQCSNETFTKYIQAAVTNGAPISGLGSLHLLVPDVNKCTIFEKFQQCSMKVISQNCTAPSVDLANSVLNVIKKTTTCDHLLKSQASSARVVDIVLITAVTAMSLRFIYA